MTARSKARGHKIIYDESKKSWVYYDGKGNASGNRPCVHCGRPPVLVKVKIPADLSSTGKVKWKRALIDGCIAPIVRALQKGGIDMRGSCCGHGKGFGDIHLQDNRMLIIIPGQLYYKKIQGKLTKIFKKTTLTERGKGKNGQSFQTDRRRTPADPLKNKKIKKSLTKQLKRAII